MYPEFRPLFVLFILRLDVAVLVSLEWKMVIHRSLLDSHSTTMVHDNFDLDLDRTICHAANTLDALLLLLWQSVRRESYRPIDILQEEKSKKMSIWSI